MRYFVVYTVNRLDGKPSVFGNAGIQSDEPIHSYEKITEITKEIAEIISADPTQVTVLYWRKFDSPE